VRWQGWYLCFILVCRSLPLPNTVTATRQEYIDYFNNVWAQTEVLFACLQGMQLVSRHISYMHCWQEPVHSSRHRIFSNQCCLPK